MRRTHLFGLALLVPACADSRGPADPTGDATSGPPATITNDPDTTGDPAPTSDATTATTADPATTATTGESSESGAPDGPPTLTRIGETFEIPTLAVTMPKRFADAAHDPAGDVY